MSVFSAAALMPKRSLSFLIREYLEPLSNGERLLVAATFLTSFVSANGVQARLEAAYGPVIGWVGALAIEAVYIGAALAGTSARHRSQWQLIGIWSVLLIAGALAVVFNLAHQEQARGALTTYTSIEAVGFPLLSLLCAIVSHGLAGERLEVTERHQAQRDKDARRVQAEQAALALEMQRQQQELAVQAERERLELARWEAVQAAKQRVRAMQVQAEPVQSGAVQEAAPPCPNCSAVINPASAYRIRQRGYCKQCQAKR